MRTMKKETFEVHCDTIILQVKQVGLIYNNMIDGDKRKVAICQITYVLFLGKSTCLI